ncbi:MAG: DUF6691 family protein [Pseudomonadota bacterium]
MRGILSFASGALFGSGLMLSGMTDTTKVLGWLDIFGAWDPTLGFVLGGAILPMALAWKLRQRSGAPIAGGTFPAPPSRKIGRDLAVGAALFGAGWGLAGLCPGPALASISWGGVGGAVFLVAMSAGMVLAQPLGRRLALA